MLCSKSWLSSTLIPLLTRPQWEEEDALTEGIERLATVIKTLQHEQNTTGSYKIRLQVEQEAKDFW